jgi:hypothetical protein
LQPYAQSADCFVRLTRIPQLLLCVFIAAGTLYSALFRRVNYTPLFRATGWWGIELLCLLYSILLIYCLGWASECGTLEKPTMTVGMLTSAQNGLNYQRLTFEFFTPDGERFGGYTRYFGKVENVVVVFYDPRNPDRNMAHRSLHFHSVAVREVMQWREYGLPAEPVRN